MLFAEGVYVTGFFYPVVPQGRARIRTQMSAALASPDIEQGGRGLRARRPKDGRRLMRALVKAKPRAGTRDEGRTGARNRRR